MLRRLIAVPALALAAVLALAAQPNPQPPCGKPALPAYPALQAAPVVQVWDKSDWTPPGCVGWSAAPSSVLVALAARFHYPGGAEGLRGRIGTVSGMTGLLYWSATHQKWQPLILEAYALTGPEGERRGDFSLDEVAAGQTLAIRQEDNLLGKATYELRVLTASADHVVFATENLSPIRYIILTLFQPREIQSICFLDREAKDVWRYYSISRMARQAAVLSEGHDASLINRAAAFYRHLAGIPADREPPAAAR